MKKISFSSLKELVKIFVFANTPKSFLRALVLSSEYDAVLTQNSYEKLSESYNELTSRAKRTPVVTALAYTVLVALLKKSENVNSIDASCLDWGEQIKEHVDRTQKSSQLIILSPPGRSAPTLHSRSSSGFTFIKDVRSDIHPQEFKLIT